MPTIALPVGSAGTIPGVGSMGTTMAAGAVTAGGGAKFRYTTIPIIAQITATMLLIKSIFFLLNLLLASILKYFNAQRRAAGGGRTL